MSNIKLQTETFESIKRICTNYQKDSESRKNKEYLSKRLDSLENLWKDFHDRHVKLTEEEDRRLQYFTDNIYEKTKVLYETTRTDILRRLMATTEKPIEISLHQPSGADEKMKELLSRQECNLKALDRAMSKVNVDAVTERWELEDHLQILKSKWEAVEKCHWELEISIKGDNQEYNELFAAKEHQYDSLKKSLNSKMWSTIHYQSSAPKINLPEFTGNYNQWLSFKDLFLEAIHNNPAIPKTQKMQHLKSKLRGEPERLVQHLVISGDNYDTCWDILNQRYDNRRLQFTSLMNTMMQLPTLTQATAPALKKMHDVINECVNGLHNIGMNTISWDPVIVYLIAQKLDSMSYNEYMRELRNPKEVPDLEEFLSFLENKFMAMESAKGHQKGAEGPSYSQKQSTSTKSNYNYNHQQKHQHYENYKNEVYSKIYHTSFGSCPLCNGSHVLMQCPKFVNMDSYQRNNTVAKLRVCKNCLYSHGNTACTSSKTCKECNKQHHTLLHFTVKRPMTNRPTELTMQPSASSNHLFNKNIEVLLTTVELKVKTVTGDYIILRALLDQGSQVNLITENAAQRLKLPRRKLTATVSGIGTISGDCKGRLQLECKSNCTGYTFNTDVLIIQRLTNKLPSESFGKTNWPHIQGLQLADPDYNLSRDIDLLLGADIYSQVILEGVLKGTDQAPTAQQTQLGWILCGKLLTFNCHVAIVNIQELTKFWETEDITQNSSDISKNDWCEMHYQQTTQRGKDGKYVVQMPLIPDYQEKLSKSKPIAVSQFLQLERKFERKQKLATMYKDFMKEYIELGHMKESSSNESIQNFLPHHGVLREQSTTTKLRTVFNASQKTTGGCSLNDVMEKGANLQNDIQNLITLWRTYKYVYTADIEKMYRCIWINANQQPLLKIIWRNNPSENLREYQLCTVTYGTKSAPWLAMRTLQQLAEDDGHKYPQAAQILKTQFYVDDLISGNNSLEAAKCNQESLINLLKGGGMNLRKWSSNEPELLRNLSEDQISQQNIFDFKDEETMKTLGLGWNPKNDVFIFNWSFDKDNKELTKRSLLSQISKLYDPLGWLSPVTVSAKLLFQKVWLSKLNWDDVLPEELQNEWLKIKTELPLINNIKINRWVGCVTKRIELHGFCDASEKAYGCVIYSRVTNENGKIEITLLTAKTRVVPVARKISLPRLELCGALLLTQLMDKVKKSLSDYDVTTYAWCDSKVTLAWIQGDNKKWEKYVANRVEKIKHVIQPHQWQHVKSELNPADYASRGLLPTKMTNLTMWWNGPEFLKNFEKTNHTNTNCFFTTSEETYIQNKDSNSEQKTNDCDNFINKLLHKHSSLSHVQRITAWVIRYVTCLRNRMQPSYQYLTTSELEKSAELVLKYVQKSEFTQEYKQLQQNKVVSTKSPLYKLSPYIDNNGILRLKGRLQHSELPINMKNPVIVPYSSRFTELLIDHAHTLTLHGGTRLTLCYIRQQYWIISGNRAVKARLRRCVTCHRHNSSESSQRMGDLPKQRVTPSRPFTHTGVDFTGNVDVKLNKGRGVKTSKAYIAIFVCMVTKAVHIELVSELSTEAFIAAFQRMCARRGTPAHMYSDNGTNFVGASRVLQREFEIFKQLLTSEFFTEIAKLQVQWHFTAPAWPNSGGLYESAVKSMKHHLRRVLGEQKLTWEEFSTLLAKIEACMNSRPLCPLTEDPEQFYNCLTPGHFITGSNILSLPQPNPEERNLNLRKRWQLTEHMLQHFWKAWSNDYLNTLQTRSKWHKILDNLKINDIVLVKEENLPPGKWAMGRITEIHPGKDGLVRVVTLKTATGLLKRPVIKLAPLPVHENREESEMPAQQIKESPASLNQRSKTKRKNCLFTFITLLTTFFALIIGSNCSTTAMTTHITQLEPERPLYYDELGKINSIHNEWIILIYYNLTYYWQGMHQIKNYLSNVEAICQKIDPSYCHITTEQLYYEMDMLKHYNNILLSPHKHMSLRKKRGLVNGLGYLANTLFGVLDERFAKKYLEDIKKIQDNENHILALTKNQTSIIEIQNNILKKSEDNIKRQSHLLEVFMRKGLTRLENEVQTMMAATYFGSTALTAHLLLNNLKSVQETILNSIMQIYQGHMDIHLITPNNLGKQLDDIAGKLPKTLSLPVDDTRDYKDLYKLIYVKARTVENYVLYELHIPLLSDDDYSLFQVIPIPITYYNETRYLQTTSNYMAVNLKKDTYLKLTNEEFKKCIPRTGNNFLCNTDLPVFNIHSKNAACEVAIIGQRPDIARCNSQRLPCKDAWIKLHSVNSWLTTCCEEHCLLRVICNDDVTAHSITKTSIITLGQNCIAQFKDITILSHNVYESTIEANSNIKIPTLNSSINKIVNFTLSSVIKDSLPHMPNSELEEIDHRIELQKRMEDTKLQPISGHDIHQYAISYIMVTILTTVSIIWTIRKYLLPRCKKQAKDASDIYEDIELPSRPQAAATASAAKRRTESPRRKQTNDPSFNFD